MTVLAVLAVLAGVLLLGWIITLFQPAAEAHAQREQEKEDAMLASMTKRQRRAYHASEAAKHRQMHSGHWSGL